MDLHLSNVLVTVVAMGVVAHWIAWWFRLPAIVLFTIAGLVAGPLLGWLQPSEDLGPVFRPVIGLCVAVILFEGGLTLRFHELREAAVGVRRLCSIGAVLSWVLGSAAAHGIGGLSWPVSLTLGAILVVTGPTVILPMLRQAGLNRRSASYLKWEGIINDPIGALLTVLVFQYFLFQSQGGGTIEDVFVTMGWGILIAIFMGGTGALALGRAFQRGWVPEFLKSPLTLGLVLVVYALANRFQHEAGLLAVTVMGLVLGNMDLTSLEPLRRFKEYIAILLVSSVFILLTADLDPELLLHLDWRSALLLVAVVFLVRPLTIFAATQFTDMEWRDRVLLALFAPRGIVAAAVAGVIGPELIAAGYPDGELLLPLVFAVIVVTVVVYGFSLRRLAKWLNLSSDPHGVLIVGASPWSTELARSLSKDLKLSVLLVDSSWHRLRDARLAGVQVIYGEVLSEQVQQSMELNEISCVLAATSNDAYNSLVCSHFAAQLEHDRVFQLPMYSDDPNGSKSLARPLRGISAFGETAQYEELWRCHFQDWKFFKTRITEGYSYEDFQRECPAGSVTIGILREDGRFNFHSPLSPARPRNGDIIVYYASAKLAAARLEASNLSGEEQPAEAEVDQGDEGKDDLTTGSPQPDTSS
ncbi:MAG: sodium:proton antiporter [Salinisphaeraceae bacterium]|nr:sodium:proton antiporter [Salinisphaeraceae bacterium]